MKAFIFAAGLGTRLKPLTDTMPKALVPVGGKPLLTHVLNKLQQEDFDQFVVNIHHFGEQIINYLDTHCNQLNISISDERACLLETGGAIKKAISLLGNESFLIHNVDILSNARLRDLMQLHLCSAAAATLLVSKRKSSRYLLFDANMRLKAWTNTLTGEIKSPFPYIDVNTLTPYAFSGIHCFAPILFPAMANYPDKFSIIDFYLDQCLLFPIYGYKQTDLQLLDVGKLDSLQQAETFCMDASTPA